MRVALGRPVVGGGDLDKAAGTTHGHINNMAGPFNEALDGEDARNAALWGHPVLWTTGCPARCGSAELLM